MSDVSIILFEHTEIMTGMRQAFSMNFFESGNSAEDERIVIEFLRLAVKIFLRCPSLEAAHTTVTYDLLKRLKLASVLKHIRVPKYVLQSNRNRYRLDRVFSKTFNSERWVADQLCDGILRGVVSKYPKNYMSDYAGYERAKYCLSYHVQRMMPFYGILDLYQFSSTPEFNTFLKARFLQNVRMKLFDSPVEYLHESLPEGRRNESYFHVYDTLYRVLNKYYVKKYPDLPVSLQSDKNSGLAEASPKPQHPDTCDTDPDAS